MALSVIDSLPWCITLDNSKRISRLRFGAKNSRVNGINDLPVFMHQGSPAARNTLDSARIPRASKLLICGLFQKGRVLAQDGVHWYNTQRLLEPIGNVAPVLCQNSAQLASTKEPCLSKSNSNSSTRTGYAAAANI